ncbi:MAG: polysaccharide deacetylase family protein [Verrucomicrobia bacterium]|nr:polysaccharide deacetylase family protein [Verrucomicrobiota bacterium]
MRASVQAPSEFDRSVAIGKASAPSRGAMGNLGQRFLWPALRTVVPFQLWPRLSRVSLVVPYYHMVSDAEVPHVRHLYRFRTVREFEADLDFFLRHFTPVELEDVVAALGGERGLPPRPFHLTFDDGFREMHDVVAPLLQKKGIPATFFLNSAFIDQGGMAHHNKISLLLDRISQPISNRILHDIEKLLPPSINSKGCLQSRLLAIRYADRETIDQMAAIAEVDINQYIKLNRPYLSSEEVFNLQRFGFTIGAHSIDHPLYADLSVEEQVRQTRVSMDFILRKFGVRIRAFAFPHSDAGVIHEFFEPVFATGVADVCFGTRGLVRHFHPRNVERFSMEKTTDAAKSIIARQYAKALYSQALRKNAGA